VTAPAVPPDPFPTLSAMDSQTSQDYALRIAPLTASVANFCDHAEHNEVADRDWVLQPAAQLRALACEIADAAGMAIVDLYAERLGAIEARNVLGHPGAFDGHRGALEAESWRELQLVQARHDEHYHQDVCGLAKAEQLRHYALHLSKIVGAFADPSDERDLLDKRLPDLLLFAIKLATVMGVRLPDEPLPCAAAVRDGLGAARPA
jgi:hypothetical protein